MNINNQSDPQHAVIADDSNIDFREFLDTLWNGRWLVIGVLSLALLVSVLYMLIAPPVYRANGLMQVEHDKDGITASVDQLSSLIEARPSDASAEVSIVKSRMVFSSVISRLQLDISATPKYFPLIGKAIVRHHEPSDALAEPFLGMQHFAWGGESIRVTAFDVPQKQLDSNYSLEATQDGFELSDSKGTQILRGKVGERAVSGEGDSRVELFVQELHARPGTRFNLIRYSPIKVYDWINSSLSVIEQPKDSGILSMQVDADSPQLASNLLNEIESSYLTQNVERRSTQAQQSLEFLKKQLPELKAKVEEAQGRLNAYQLQAGTVDVQQETQLVLKQAVDLETQRLALVQNREAAKERYTAQHPAVVTFNQQIDGIEREQAAIKQRISALPERQQEVLSLMRDLEVNTQLYTALLNSAQQLQITKAGTTGNVRIVDRALSRLEPVKPNKTIVILIGLFVGTVLGVLAVFIARSMLPGVDQPEEVERIIGLPCYASIPYSKAQAQLSRSKTFQKTPRKSLSRLLALRVSEDPAMESLRSLRTTLHFAMIEATNNVIIFTGPTAGVGKSFVTINLGAVLANIGKRVIVIDADLRRGFLAQHLDVEAKPGLSDYIAGTYEFDSVLQKNLMPNFDFIPGGARPPNPSEILMSERFSKLLSNLSEIYDYVLIDTPPALPVTDSAIVGRLAGTTLVVLKAAEHPMRAIDETVKRLRQGGATVQGIIMNKVGIRIGSHGYGRQAQTYGYAGYGGN